MGVPVNKRKSLLMKPRHYSPSTDCKGDREDRTEEDSPLETSNHSAAGSEEECPQFDLVPGIKIQSYVEP